MRRTPAVLLSSIVLCGLTLMLAAAIPNTKRSVKSAVKNDATSKPKAPAFGNADAISTAELKGYDYFLASDQIEGRNLPSRGYDIASLYVASHLYEWGLMPGGSTTGTNGPYQPYFMPIDLVATNPNPAGMKMAITIPTARNGRGGRGGFGFGGPAQLAPGSHDIAYGNGWVVEAPRGRNAPPLTGGEFANAAIVYAGNGYVIGGNNPYQGMDVRGKVVVVGGMPQALAAFEAATRAAQLARRTGGSAPAVPPNPMGPNDLTPQQYAAKNGAAALIVIPSFAQLSEMEGPNAGKVTFGPNGPNYNVTKFLPADNPGVPTITAGMELVHALFQSEKATGAEVFDASNSNAALPSFALNPGKTLSATVAISTTHNHGQDVIGILEGSDPVLKNEYVIMSAHLDHIGLAATPNCAEASPELAAGDVTDGGLNAVADQKNCDGISNGADDDGSGSTGLLGIAHAYAEGAAKGMRPKRTLLFIWNAGEEKGLWGSQYFNEFPPIDLSKVVVDLNMDMIGRTKTPGYVDPRGYLLVEPHETLVVGPNISSNDLEGVVESVNNSFQKMKLNHYYDVTVPDATHDSKDGVTQRIFYRSDHYNFAKMGIPIAFFSDGLHVDYHRITDSPEKIDYTEIQEVSKTVAAVAWVIGNQPEGKTPKLNSTLPAQLVKDMAAVKAAGWGKITPVLPPLPGEPF